MLGVLRERQIVVLAHFQVELALLGLLVLLGGVEILFEVLVHILNLNYYYLTN